jgi:hypothetical protein
MCLYFIALGGGGVTYLPPVYSKFCKQTFYTKNGVQIFMIPMFKTALWVPTNHAMQTLLYFSKKKKKLAIQKNRYYLILHTYLQSFYH